jgi:hypothetical protein
VRPRSSTHIPRRPHADTPPPGCLSGDMWEHVGGWWVKCVHGMRKYPARQCCVCTVHKSQTRYICEFCVMPLHKGECFQRCHTHSSTSRSLG